MLKRTQIQRKIKAQKCSDDPSIIKNSFNGQVLRKIFILRILLVLVPLSVVNTESALSDPYTEHGWTCAKLQQKLNTIEFPKPAKFEGFEGFEYDGTYLFGRCSGGDVIVNTDHGQKACKGWIQGGGSSRSFYGYDPNMCKEYKQKSTPQ